LRYIAISLRKHLVLLRLEYLDLRFNSSTLVSRYRIFQSDPRYTMDDSSLYQILTASSLEALIYVNRSVAFPRASFFQVRLDIDCTVDRDYRFACGLIVGYTSLRRSRAAG